MVDLKSHCFRYFLFTRVLSFHGSFSLTSSQDVPVELLERMCTNVVTLLPVGEDVANLPNKEPDLESVSMR